MRSIQSVVISLGKGSLSYGFTNVTATAINADNSITARFVGSLPHAPKIAEYYQVWQSIYLALSQRLVMLSPVEDDDELEIDSFGITHVSQVSFQEVCQNMADEFNSWLQCPEFLQLEQKLRSHLSTTAIIRIIIETDDRLVERLPWHSWSFLQDYAHSEIALSQPEYSQLPSPQLQRQKVRILAILGNSQDIDIVAEQQALSKLSDAETKFLVKPSRREFDRELWDPQGWDILFFAGHSCSEDRTGRIYINESAEYNSLTIEQLREALKAAIARGLKLAIFNSCDGLGLANALEKLHIPQVIVMREPVPNFVAQQFFHYFLTAFAVNKLPLYLAVKEARCRLQGLEQDYPAASWLPIICQNPAVRSPDWLDLGGIPSCPYRGLYAFQEEDAELFFGREDFVNNLRTRVEQESFVAVVGASGSGKSSVVFAGLVPQLRQSNAAWDIVAFHPGNNPMSAMAMALSRANIGQVDLSLSGETALLELIESSSQLTTSDRLSAMTVGKSFSTAALTVPLRQSSKRLLLIVDQFEELYTLTNSQERQTFLQNLMAAVNNAPTFTLIITLRSDFYGETLSYRPLGDLLQNAVVNLSGMNHQELKEAIALPAKKKGVKLEQGLSDKLINSLKKQSGRLPLLEFTLTQLWSQQHNGWLTHQAYDSMGGVESALANHAETVYTQLDRFSRLKMSTILLQLVQLGEGAEVTRRLATKDEVKAENWDLVSYLADARLVVTDCDPIDHRETVEITHEALINNWSRLKQWLKADEDFRRWQQKIRRAVATWNNSNGDRGTLLRGKPLGDAKYWQQNRGSDLSDLQHNFINQSIKLQQLELRRERRRRRTTISSLVVGLVLAILLSGIAGWQWQNSAINEIIATSKYAKLLCASMQGFDGLLESLVAAQKTSQTAWAEQNPEVRRSVMSALQETVYGVRERNRIEVGEPVRSVSFSPDGQTIASASNSSLQLWQSDGSLQKSIDTKQQTIERVVFSPDGKAIATAGEDGTLKLWGPNGRLNKTFKAHRGPVNAVSYSPEGLAIATVGEDGILKIWSQDELQQSISGNSGSLSNVTYSPDGKMLATAGEDGTVKLWDLDGRLIQTISGYQQAVIAVAFSPDSQILAASSNDGTVKFWNLEGTLLHEMAEENVVHDIHFTPDNRTIVSVGGDTIVKLWNSDYSLRSTFTGHTDGILELALTSNGKTIASASADGSIKLWQLDSELFKTLQLHDDNVYAAVFSPDNQTIATASGDNTVKLWKTDGILLNTLNGHTDTVHSVSFSPDGNLIATASWDKTAKIWKTDGTLLNTLNGHTDRVYMANFSPDGTTIATASSDRTIKLWQLDGKLLHTLTGHQDVIHGLNFSPDGNIIASASHDRTVKLWNTQGKLLKTLVGHNNWIHSVSFSPDGNIIASASHDHTIKLWNLDGVLIDTIAGHKDKVLGVAFSPDGQTIASSSKDGSVRLWQIDGTPVATFRGHGDWVHSVNFSPDDRSLVSASYDNTAIVWDLTHIKDLDVLVQRGCNWAEDYLQTSSDERNICRAYIDRSS